MEYLFVVIGLLKAKRRSVGPEENRQCHPRPHLIALSIESRLPIGHLLHDTHSFIDQFVGQVQAFVNLSRTLRIGRLVLKGLFVGYDSVLRHSLTAELPQGMNVGQPSVALDNELHHNAAAVVEQLAQDGILDILAQELVAGFLSASEFSNLLYLVINCGVLLGLRGSGTGIPGQAETEKQGRHIGQAKTQGMNGSSHFGKIFMFSNAKLSFFEQELVHLGTGFVRF